MTIERLTELLTFRRRIGALSLGGAVCMSVFGSPVRGLVAFGALASHPKVYDLSHAISTVVGVRILIYCHLRKMRR